MENWILFKWIDAVCDVQVVTDIGVSVVCIAVRRLSIDVGLVQFAGVLASQVRDSNSPWVPCVNLRECSRDYLNGADSDTGLLP